jgi:hypothetical protein
MKDFMVRVWNGKNKEMIYAGENFYWILSLDGEVFRGLGTTSIKDKEDCHIMLYTGCKDVNDVEIYEGDYLSIDYGSDSKRRGRSAVIFKDGFFGFTAQRCPFPLNKYNLGFFDARVVGNIYENKKV